MIIGILVLWALYEWLNKKNTQKAKKIALWAIALQCLSWGLQALALMATGVL